MSIKSILKAPVFALGHSRVLGTLTGVRTEEKVAALTFDDGPHPENTPALLEILKRHGAQATFFTLGFRMQQNPHLVKRLHAEGHAVCSHGWSHTSFPTMSSRARRGELRRWRKASRSTGQAFFRPPYGHQTLASRLDCKRAGYRIVTWNVVVEDWRRQEPGVMASRLINEVHPGCIILLHDAVTLSSEVQTGPDFEPDRRPMLEAVDAFLREKAGEYRFVTLPALLRHGRPIYKNWYRFTRDVS